MANNPDSIPASTPLSSSWYRKREVVFMALFILVLVFSLSCMSKGWRGSLMEMYAFRQTQTAISVDYMLKGGDLLCYETPVLGPPWSIPMEFPFYHYLVFILVKMTGYPLDQAGRLISVFFFLSLLYPLYALVKTTVGNKTGGGVVLSLLCLSPQYLYWSRTFMIESAALAMSLWYLFFVTRYVDRNTNSKRRLLLLVMILGFGIISSITKVTTFFVYYLFAFLCVFSMAMQSLRTIGLATYLKRNIPLLIVGFILPLVSIFVWTNYTDFIKSMNPVGTKLMSANLNVWNFGTWQQKFSAATWIAILFRSVTDLFGNVWVMMVFLLLPLCKKRTILASLFLLFMFLLPVFVFTNLYYVHSYYVYANGIILIAAIALIISEVETRGTTGKFLSLALFAVISIASIQFYISAYLPQQGTEFRYQQLKKNVDIFTKPDDILLYFGADWSSEMPYYVNRRASMFPDSLTTPENFLLAIEKLRPYRIGGIVFCGWASGSAAKQQRILDYIGVPLHGVTVPVERCEVYFPYKEN